MLRGARLYSDAWTNKPPLHVAVVAATVRLGGTAEWSLHALTFVTGALALAAVGWATRRIAGPRRAAVALVLAALLIGLPVFDSEVMLPEALLIAATAWAGALVVTRLHGGGGERAGVSWSLGAGLLAAAAVCIQQTALTDAAALALVLAVAPGVRRRHVVAYLAGFATATVAWLLAAVAWAGLGTVAFALAGFYVAYTQSVLPGSSGGVARHAAILMLAAALLVAGALLLRRRPVASWAWPLWAGATLLVPAAAQQPYPHFLLPAMVPVSLTLANLRLPRPRGLVHATGMAAVVAGVAITASIARVAGADWSPGPLAVHLDATRSLADYYHGAFDVATGRQTLDGWQASFDDRVAGDTACAAWLRDHGLAGHPGIVWSSDAWVYLLADLPLVLRTAPIYNNEVLLGVGGPVADRVRAIDPEVIVTSDDAVQEFPEITGLLDQRYRAVARFGPDQVWLRQDVVPAGGA